MILGILQARLSSTRLPGKVLMELCGKPMLEHQIKRILYSKLIGKLVVATSDQEEDYKLADLCAGLGVECYRGSLDDVLDRFYKAAEKLKPDHVVRLTGDCPLADHLVIDKVIQCYLDSKVDYASNTIKPSFPDGLDVEVMSFAALETAWQESKKPSEREHVTPFIVGHPEMFKLANYSHTQNLSSLRWTVDEPEDFQFVQSVYDRLYEINPRFDMTAVLALLKSEPELSKVNQRFRRNEGLVKSLAEDEVLE